MNGIEIINSLDKFPFSLHHVRAFIESVLKEIEEDNWCVGLLISDDETIRNHNRKWRNIDTETDVLSFVQSDGEPIPSLDGQPVEAGDIVVSYERVLKQSKFLNRPLEEELRRVIIHGILHLKGMVHPGDDYEGEMLKLQEKIVSETRSLAVTT